MSKRKKKPKKRQLKYRESQFIDILCNGCRICGDYVEPSFCFSLCYKTNPSSFLKHCYMNLVRRKEWPFANNRKIDTSRTWKNEKKVFREVFCDAGCCTPEVKNGHSECLHTGRCISRFREQVRNSREETTTVSLVPRHVKNKKRKKNKNRKVVQPYSTFITSDDKEFQREIREIIYGLTYNEQTGGKQLSTEST